MGTTHSRSELLIPKQSRDSEYGARAYLCIPRLANKMENRSNNYRCVLRTAYRCIPAVSWCPLPNRYFRRLAAEHCMGIFHCVSLSIYKIPRSDKTPLAKNFTLLSHSNKFMCFIVHGSTLLPFRKRAEHKYLSFSP